MIKVKMFLENKRRILSGVMACLVAVMGVLVIPASAHASIASGTRQVWVGSGYGVFQWNASNDSLALHSDPWTLGGGQCGDAIFDWDRTDYNPATSDHHDARIVRVCQSRGSHGVDIATDTGGSLQGMQKAGFCIGPDNATTSGSCANASGAVQVVQGNVNVSLPNNCVRAWKKNSNGTTVYYSGGASTSCTS